MCIGAIGGLSSMKTANTGCKLGIAGVAGSLTTTYLGVADGYHALGGGERLLDVEVDVM